MAKTLSITRRDFGHPAKNSAVINIPLVSRKKVRHKLLVLLLSSNSDMSHVHILLTISIKNQLLQGCALSAAVHTCWKIQFVSQQQIAYSLL